MQRNKRLKQTPMLLQVANFLVYNIDKYMKKCYVVLNSQIIKIINYEKFFEKHFPLNYGGRT